MCQIPKAGVTGRDDTGGLGDILAPDLHAVLDCLADLGLTDAEIARYYTTEPVRIVQLRGVVAQLCPQRIHNVNPCG
jgi:hypothetical protein